MGHVGSMLISFVAAFAVSMLLWPWEKKVVSKAEAQEALEKQYGGY